MISLCFRDWLLSEGIYGNFNYIFPTDKKQQLYDFYMIQRLYTLNSLDRTRSQSGIMALQPSTAGDEGSQEQKVDYAVKEATKTILSNLQEDFLSALFFSISCELRHTEKQSNYNKVCRRATGCPLTDDEFAMMEEFLKNIPVIHKNLNHDDFESASALPEIQKIYPSKREKADVEQMRMNPKRVASFIATKAFPQKDFINMAVKVFGMLLWDEQYGGKAWEEIANAWLQLKSAKTDQQRIIQIDHIYDLEHNNGSVFNKVFAYQIDGNFDWFKNVLDHKAEIDEPHELLKFVSPSMNKLATIALFNKTGKTIQQYEDEQKKAKTEFQNNIPSQFSKGIAELNTKTEMHLWFQSVSNFHEYVRGIVSLTNEPTMIPADAIYKVRNILVSKGYKMELDANLLVPLFHREAAALSFLRSRLQGIDSAIYGPANYNVATMFDDAYKNPRGSYNSRMITEIRDLLDGEFGYENFRNALWMKHVSALTNVSRACYPTREWQKLIFNFVLEDFHAWKKSSIMKDVK